MWNYHELLRIRKTGARIILWLLAVPLILVSVAGNTSAPAHRAGVSAQPARVVEGYGRLPLAFEANRGQADAQVKFFSRGAGYSLFLTSDEAVLTLSKGSREKPASSATKFLPTKDQPVKQEKPSVLRMKLLGANAKAEVTGQDQLPGRSNYFRGNDPKKWQTDVPQYAKVQYANIYPGVDLVYYGKQRELEYDFVVRPGADPNVIRLGIEGEQKLRLEHGELVLMTAAGELRLRRPHTYQQSNGRKREIGGRYVIKANNEVGFAVASYDPRETLVIDPVLAYSTMLCGTSCACGPGSSGDAIAVDAMGNAYVTGGTCCTDFPTGNATQSAYAGGGDAFVTKLNVDGSAVIYSDYFGGSGYEYGSGIAVDSSGNAYVVGSTGSTDFPTLNAIQPTNHGDYDAFIIKVNAGGGGLAYSSYLGGSDADGAAGVAVDAVGNAFVAGGTNSTDFPIARGIQPTYGGNTDAFVSKINATGSAFLFSTYLGGSSAETGRGIAVDTLGNAYIVGSTCSTDFPVANAIQPTNQGGSQYYCGDAFVAKIAATGTRFIYSTYLGGSDGDDGFGVAVDAAGNAYVTGQTASTNFPMANAIQPYMKNGGQGADAFITKLNAAGGPLIFSTYLGGSHGDYAEAIAVDAAGNVYVTGTTSSIDFPSVNAIQPYLKNPSHNSWLSDAFITKLNTAGNVLIYSTYWGGSGHDQGNGIAADAAGNAYVTGLAESANFPTSAAAFQLISTPSGAGFVMKIAPQTYVSMSPTNITFSTLVIGKTSATKQVTISNHGPGPLTINDIFIAGVNASDFAIHGNDCPSTLSAGGFCSVSVAFTPTNKNKRQGALAVSDSDPASPNSIPLSGTGMAVSLSLKSLVFGKVPVGNTSAPKTVILTNVGSTQLNFAGMSITGTSATDYSQTNTCGASIAAGASCGITVIFKPTVIGIRKATVKISDDGGGSPQVIALNGTGI